MVGDDDEEGPEADWGQESEAILVEAEPSEAV